MLPAAPIRTHFGSLQHPYAHTLALHIARIAFRSLDISLATSHLQSFYCFLSYASQPFQPTSCAPSGWCASRVGGSPMLLLEPSLPACIPLASPSLSSVSCTGIGVYSVRCIYLAYLCINTSHTLHPYIIYLYIHTSHTSPSSGDVP